MSKQKDEILKMVVALKAIKIPVSVIEVDLGFSNGTIGKAAKGIIELNTEKYDKLDLYFKDKLGVKPKINKTELVVEGNGQLKEKPSEELKGTLKDVTDKINKDFGAGTVMRFGDKPSSDYKVISTGSLQLDNALGIGGLPLGRIIEIFGWESSGKTTIALNVIANAQKEGLKCLLIDAENAFDPEYASALGVNVDDLLYCQPSYGEQGLEVADREMASGKIGVVVIDSVAALVPKAELEGEHGDSKMGLHARLMSQTCRKIVGTVAKNNVICIFINQFRHKIGVMYGSPEVTTGGNALQFYASIRLEVRRSTTEKNSVMNGDIKEGNQTTVKVIKNKCAPPFRSATFNIMYGTGIDRISEVVDLGVELGIIEKAGTWYSYQESKLGQGKEAVKEVLTDNEEMRDEIEEKIKNSIKLKPN
jgi:recombination protein RecA